MFIELSLVEGLGLIGKLLPQLKTFTGARRREYFDKLLTPLFESLEGVHKSYDQLFIQTRDKLSQLKLDAAQEAGVEAGSVTGDTLKALENIKEEFSRLRRTDESFRDTVRRDAQEDLANISWAEERRFLVVVGHYFLRAWPIRPDDDSLDREIQSLIEHGGRDRWPTPSTRFYGEIQHSANIGQIIEILDKARDDLNERWVHVHARYRRVAVLLIKET